MQYLLLYNMLGYVRNGSKRALIKRIEEKSRKESGICPILWIVLDEHEKEVAAGIPTRERSSYGCVLRTCDFSSIVREGTYRLKVVLSNNEILSSEPFEIRDYPYLNDLLKRLSIFNAQARYAQGTESGGYYDCNSKMGEAYSHGMFLNGLCWFSVLHGTRLSHQEKKQVFHAQRIAFDYLLKLWEKDGHFRNHAVERPFDPRNISVGDTIEAVYGLVAYLDLIGLRDPERCTCSVYEQLFKSYNYAQSHMQENPKYASGQWRVPVLCHFYRISGDKKILKMAEQAAQWALNSFDWRENNMLGWLGIGHMEGIWMLCEINPKFKCLNSLQDLLARQQLRLEELLMRNDYRFPPISDFENVGRSWDNMQDVLPGIGSRHWILNQDVLITGLDALYLACISGRAEYEQVVSGAIGFIGGMHFGISPEMTVCPQLSTASFVANLPYSVRPWKTWYFEMQNSLWSSVVNGYTVENGSYFYTDTDWPQGETFIKTDGTLLRLASLYECMMSEQKMLPDSTYWLVTTQRQQEA